MKLEAYCSGFLLLLLIAAISTGEATAVRGHRRAMSSSRKSGKKMKKDKANSRSKTDKLVTGDNDISDEDIPREEDKLTVSDEDANEFSDEEIPLSDEDVLDADVLDADAGDSGPIEPTSRTCQAVYDGSYEYIYDQKTFQGIPWHNQPLPKGFPDDASVPEAYNTMLQVAGVLPVVLNTFYAGKCARRQNAAFLAGENIDGAGVCDVARPFPALAAVADNIEVIAPQLIEMFENLTTTNSTPPPTKPPEEMTLEDQAIVEQAQVDALIQQLQLLGKFLRLPQGETNRTIDALLMCQYIAQQENPDGLTTVQTLNMVTECSFQDSPVFGWDAPNDVQSFNLGVNDSFYQMYKPPQEVVEAYFEGPDDEVGTKWMSDDDLFGYMRLTGPNPDMIRKAVLTDVGPGAFAVSDEMWQTVMDVDSTLDEAIENGEVYILDFSALQGAEGTYGEQILFSPKTLFGINEAGNLAPVAIQVYSDPSHEDNDIIVAPQQRSWEEATPAEKVDLLKWSLAKTAVNSAESTYFEVITHLARTHLVMEPIIISSKRHLPSEHPISMLLQNHIFGTVNINQMAAVQLMSPGSTIDWAFPPPIEVAQKVSTDAALDFLSNINEQTLPKRMERNGVEDIESYPYRDDAVLEWEAMQYFVEDFLQVLYSDDDEVAGDETLSCFANDLKENGMMNNFGTDGSNEFTTIEGLRDFLTLFMFTGSCQHAATNYAQGLYPIFTPAMPLSGYLNPNDVTEDNVDELSKVQGVPKERWITFAGNDVLYLLQAVRWYRLGDYVKDEDGRNEELFSGEYLKVVEKYREELAKVGEIIDERNSDPDTLRGTLMKYELLHPNMVPQSIHI